MSTQNDTDTENGRGFTYSRNDILNALREANEATDGETLIVTDYNEYSKSHDVPAASVIIDRFDDPNADSGGWVLAKESADVGSDGRGGKGRPRIYSNEDMLNMLQACENKHGRASQKVFDSDPEFCSSGAIVKRFGEWSTAKEKAGVE